MSPLPRTRTNITSEALPGCCESRIQRPVLAAWDKLVTGTKN
jgi:hypothetical protein